MTGPVYPRQLAALFLFAALGFVWAPAPAVAQVPTSQDCPGAVPVCQDTFSQPNTFLGVGNIPNEIDPLRSCLTTGERNDVWYTFTVQSGGLLCFTITPNSQGETGDDYDWAVYNLTQATCADISTNSSLEISCNYDGRRGVPTGPNGQTGGWNTPCIPVNAGETYVVNVSNYSRPQSGYTLDFSASTATIFDNVRPALRSVTAPASCPVDTVVFDLSENVLCDTAQAADFTLTGPGGPYTVTGVNGASCGQGGNQEKSFSMTLSKPIQVGGTYEMCLVQGAGLVNDLCGNRAEPSCVSFTVDCPVPPCLEHTTNDVLCETDASGNLTGNYLWNFTIQNRAGQTINHLYFLDLPGVTVDEPHLVFNLPNNGVLHETVKILGGNPGQVLTDIRLSAHNANLEECCSTKVSVQLPDCQCAQIISQITPGCFPLPPPFRYTFNLENLSSTQVEKLLLAPMSPVNPNIPLPPSQVNVVPTVLSTSLGQGDETGNRTVQISGSQVVEGGQVCLRIGAHDSELVECCSILRCFPLPICTQGPIDWTPVGDASVLFLTEHIVVSGIGSSGEDGVAAVALDSASLAVEWLDPDPAENAPNGASLRVGATAPVAGTDRALGFLRVTDVGSEYEVAAELAGAGVKSLEVEVFDGDHRIAGMQGGDGPIARVENWPVGGSAEAPASTGAYSLTLFGPSPDTVWRLANGSSATGDRLRVTAEDPNLVVPSISSLRILLADLPSLTITGATRRAAVDTACTQGPDNLCLNGSRFKVAVSWRDFQGNTGVGHAAELTPDTGYFWFFSETNVELVIKVLDGRAVNGHFWVFYGALSTVEYTITVTDTATGAVKTYSNPSGHLASAADTRAFAASAAATAPETDVPLELVTLPHEAPPGGTTSCTSAAGRLCLSGGRFGVEVVWKDARGGQGAGRAVPLSGDTGYFWFFEEDNIELVIKVLDGRALNGHWWVFYGALSDVEYTITVTDTVTGQSRTYVNPAGQLASRADTTAF